MEDLKVCRICLIMDVKMYDLQSYPLESYYESLMGASNSVYNISLPPYACYECAALVRKYYVFKQKCHRSQAVLLGITDGFGKLSLEDIRAIDRQSLHITSNLQAVNIPELTNSFQLDEKIKMEPVINDIEPSLTVEGCIKEEDHDYDNFPLADNSLSSDDDEPLSHHKEMKSKQNNKADIKNDMEEKLGLNVELEIEFTQASDDLSELSSKIRKLDKSPKVEKKKRGRPKKGSVKLKKTRVNPSLFSEDLNDMAQYITVINLSVDEQKEEINKRKQSSNYLNSPYQCDLCYKGFIDTDAWKHHVSKHSPSAGDIECPICKFRFKTKRALQKHASNHERKFACKTCPYISTNTTQAKQHQGWHKGITFKCKHCDEIFTVWTSYMSHVRIKHPSEFICGICGYSFISKLGLAMHKTMMHKDVLDKSIENKEDGGPYCSECDVKFISAEAYKRHMVMSVKHTRSTDSIKGCRTCGETFKSSEELRLHHRKEHTRKRPKNYGKKPAATSWPTKCVHCSEEIPNAREYWTHFRRVHPDKNYPVQKDYVCDICGKSFRGNAFLVYHKRTHFEERAYKCSQCDKAFFNRTNLQVHEKTHSDDRPYPCSVCFKAFKCKGALNRHFRVHEGWHPERPHPCSVCDKAFKCKGALDRHFISHTGQKPYECEVCGKGFTQSNSRKLHVRTVHLKQPAPYVSRNRLERRIKQTQKEQTTPQFIY